MDPSTVVDIAVAHLQAASQAVRRDEGASAKEHLDLTSKATRLLETCLPKVTEYRHVRCIAVPGEGETDGPEFDLAEPN